MLPELIMPKQLATEHKVLAGHLPLSCFTRAEGLLLLGQESLNFNWLFELDQQGQVTALLDLKAKLSLQCQRCEKPFEYLLSASIPMKVVDNELEAERLPLALQPLYVDKEGQCLALDVIEDELILNIPEFPKHEKKDCGFGQNEAYYDTPLNGVTSNTHKPFANLKVLKENK